MTTGDPKRRSPGCRNERAALLPPQLTASPRPSQPWSGSATKSVGFGTRRTRLDQPLGLMKPYFRASQALIHVPSLGRRSWGGIPEDAALWTGSAIGRSMSCDGNPAGVHSNAATHALKFAAAGSGGLVLFRGAGKAWLCSGGPDRRKSWAVLVPGSAALDALVTARRAHLGGSLLGPL